MEAKLVNYAASLGCEIERGVFNYLGLRIGINSHRKQSWDWLVQKIKNRIARWGGSNISIGGRATLIQSVLSSIPIYSLSLFLLPKSVILDLIKVQQGYLWGGNLENTKISWVSWDDICKPKKEGGLGIRDLGVFNIALVGKWIWRLLDEKNRLWAKIIYSKYGGL